MASALGAARLPEPACPNALRLHEAGSVHSAGINVVYKGAGSKSSSAASSDLASSTSAPSASFRPSPSTCDSSVTPCSGATSLGSALSPLALPLAMRRPPEASSSLTPSAGGFLLPIKARSVSEVSPGCIRACLRERDFTTVWICCLP
eukprot:s5249_g6.t1